MTVGVGNCNCCAPANPPGTACLYCPTVKTYMDVVLSGVVMCDTNCHLTGGGASAKYISGNINSSFRLTQVAPGGVSGQCWWQLDIPSASSPVVINRYPASTLCGGTTNPGALQIYVFRNTSRSFQMEVTCNSFVLFHGDYNLPSKTVSTLTRVGGTATATVNAHGWANGDKIEISGATPSTYNGAWIISNVAANTFDFAITGSPTTPATGTIIAWKWDCLTGFTFSARDSVCDQDVTLGVGNWGRSGTATVSWP